jgi:hypothetical protein
MERFKRKQELSAVSNVLLDSITQEVKTTILPPSAKCAQKGSSRMKLGRLHAWTVPKVLSSPSRGKVIAIIVISGCIRGAKDHSFARNVSQEDTVIKEA